MAGLILLYLEGSALNLCLIVEAHQLKLEKNGGKACTQKVHLRFITS